MKINKLFAINIAWALILILSSTCLNIISKAQTPTETPTVTPTETPTSTPTRTPVIQTPVTPTPGYLQWPRSDASPNAGCVNSSFGEYRSTHFHAGIDIPGGEEQYALACVDGIILFREKNRGKAGNVVGILDSNGYLIIYAHLSNNGFEDEFPNEDAAITVSTPVGRIGNTGDPSYKPHIHLELRNVLQTPNPKYDERADAYNPLSWLEPPWTPTPTSGNRPPYLMDLYVVPEGSASKIWAKTPAPYFTPLPEPHNSIRIPLPAQTTPTPKVFHARGRLQFMLDAWDRINYGSSKCGVYDIGYYVVGESDWKYRLQFEEIPREFIGKEELVFQKGPPASSGIGPTRYVYRLFMPHSDIPTPTPPMVIEAEPTHLGVFNTLDYPNGTPVVIRFEAKPKNIPGFPPPTPKVEEIVIIPDNPTLWVDCENGDDNNTGRDVLSPLKSIDLALYLSLPGERILVAPGICGQSTGQVFPLDIPADIILEGSGYYYPNGTWLQSDDLWDIISFNDHGNESSRIENFKISGGYTGIYINNSSPNISHTRITSNFDGVWSENQSSPTLFNCVIDNNARYGVNIRGMQFTTLYAEIRNCTISDNASHGILSFLYSKIHVVDSIISNNHQWGIYRGEYSSQLLEYINFYGNTYGAYNYIPFPGTGLIYSDPCHIFGPHGFYYLNHDAPVSGCIDSGSTSAALAGLSDRTTHPEGHVDIGRVDLGFHHETIILTVTPTHTPTPTPSTPTSTPTSGPTATPWPTDTPLPEPVAIGYYHEGFENDLDAWTWSGLWHPVSNNPSSPYYTVYAEISEGEKAFWYGQNATGDYDTGIPNSGSLVSPVILLGDHATLTFRSWEQTEGTALGLDTRHVFISIDYGETWTPVWQSTDNSSEYRTVSLNLSGYAGLPIQLRFTFDTVDEKFNNYRGWFVDDISIGLNPIPATTPMGVFVLVVLVSLILLLKRHQ